MTDDREFTTLAEPKSKEKAFSIKDEGDRKALAVEICKWANAAKSVRDEFSEGWKEILSAYYNNVPERVITDYIESPSHVAVPLLSSKLIALQDYVAGSITSPSPIFVAQSSTEDYGAIKRTEDTVEWLLSMADFTTKVWQDVEIAALYNRGMYMIDWVQTLKSHPETLLGTSAVENPVFAECGIRVKVIHPKDSIVYPNNVETVSEAIFAGYRARRSLRQVLSLMDAPNGDDAYYFTVKDITTDNDGDDVGTEEEAGGADILFENKQDEPVHIITGVAKLDLARTGRSSLYWVEVAEGSEELLHISPWTYYRPPFFCTSFRPTYGEYLTEDSVGRRLLPAQKIATESTNLLLDGTLMAQFPPGFYDVSAGLPDDMDAYQPGALYPVDSMPNIQYVTTQFNPNALSMISDMAENMGSQVLSIGDIATGVQYNPNTTASAVNAMEQARGVSTNSYLSRYAGKELTEMAQYIKELALKNYETLYAVYGEAIPAKETDLMIKCRWKVNGKSSTGSSEEKGMMIEKLMGMAVNLGFTELVPGLFKSLIENSGVPNKQELLSVIEQRETESENQALPGMGGMEQGIPPGIDPNSIPPGEGLV
jgi:hypothetical protein